MQPATRTSPPSPAGEHVPILDPSHCPHMPRGHLSSALQCNSDVLSLMTICMARTLQPAHTHAHTCTRESLYQADTTRSFHQPPVPEPAEAGDHCTVHLHDLTLSQTSIKHGLFEFGV